MRVEALELHHVALPLRNPWRTAGGSLTEREVLLVHIRSDLGDGWGECAAFADDFYMPETIASAVAAIEQLLWPTLAGLTSITAGDVSAALESVPGHRMAKSSLEMAILDIELRASAQSFAQLLGATRSNVPSGVAVGLHATTTDLVDAVGGYIAQGYRRVKLKIEPGRDIEVVAAVRSAFPDLELVVDANGSFAGFPGDVAAHLGRLDEFGLACLEQPLDADDLRGHAELATKISTRICLDESLGSLDDVRAALAARACSVVNLKAGRVGGYLEARQIHDHCRERGVPVWCGGMLETGLGRAANIALAALPGFTITGDLSASDRFYATDIINEPIEMHDGFLNVPTGPGFGVTINLDVVRRFSINS